MLKGRQVCLTALRPSDFSLLHEWIDDADLVRRHGAYRPVDEATHRRWFDSVGSDPSKIAFAVRTVGDSVLIGLLQLIGIHPVHRTAELVIRIAPAERRGKGYGTEALELALHFAFNDHNLNRVFLHVFANNAAAIRAYEKAGFTIEGRLRQAAWVEGAWEDVLLMARVRND